MDLDGEILLFVSLCNDYLPLFQRCYTIWENKHKFPVDWILTLMSSLIKQLKFSCKVALLRNLSLEEIIIPLINYSLNHKVLKLMGKIKSIQTRQRDLPRVHGQASMVSLTMRYYAQIHLCSCVNIGYISFFSREEGIKLVLVFLKGSECSRTTDLVQHLIK